MRLRIGRLMRVEGEIADLRVRGNLLRIRLSEGRKIGLLSVRRGKRRGLRVLRIRRER